MCCSGRYDGVRTGRIHAVLRSPYATLQGQIDANTELTVDLTFGFSERCLRRVQLVPCCLARSGGGESVKLGHVLPSEGGVFERLLCRHDGAFDITRGLIG